MKKYFTLLLTLSCLSVYAQNFRSPLDIPLSMSANFGELRSDHFHSGIDYRVGGVVGAKVYAVEDGYVSRIYVNPSGYGKAIYLAHYSGYTTVYGHLNAFAGDIATYTKKTQYKKEHFTLDEYLDSTVLKVKKGDVIGFAGNSGSSFGAHLHFEVRKSENQTPVNTITRKYHKANDKVAPKLYQVATYTLDTVNEVLNSIKAYIDNELFFTYKIDEFNFSETRYINSMIDYAQWISNKKHFVKTYIEPGNKLNIYHGSRNNGVIELNDTAKHRIRFEFYDDNANKSTLNFLIQKDKNSTRKAVSPANKLFIPWDAPFSYSDEELEVNIPKESFYSNQFFTIKKVAESAYSSSWAIMDKKIPLQQSVEINFRPKDLPMIYYDKLLIVKEDKGKQSSCGGNFDKKGKFSTKVRSFGTFSLALDTIPPSVKLKAKGTDFTKSKSISVSIGDNLSGIAKYAGYIDGKWALFDYDAKTATLTYVFDPERIKKGQKHKLEIVVTDYCKNQTKFTSNFTY